MLVALQGPGAGGGGRLAAMLGGRGAPQTSGPGQSGGAAGQPSMQGLMGAIARGVLLKDQKDRIAQQQVISFFLSKEK